MNARPVLQARIFPGKGSVVDAHLTGRNETGLWEEPDLRVGTHPRQTKIQPGPRCSRIGELFMLTFASPIFRSLWLTLSHDDSWSIVVELAPCD